MALKNYIILTYHLENNFLLIKSHFRFQHKEKEVIYLLTRK